MNSSQTGTRDFLRGLARAYGGALLFALPLFMTMEMWRLGFYMGRWRFVLLLALGMPLLVGLAYYSGFRDTFSWKHDIVDALVAYAVGASTACTMLFLTGVATRDVSIREILGKTILQALPASMGALLAQSQMGGSKNASRPSRQLSYRGELFLMGVGALFMGVNSAPTKAIVAIAHQTSALHTTMMMIR